MGEFGNFNYCEWLHSISSLLHSLHSETHVSENQDMGIIAENPGTSISVVALTLMFITFLVQYSRHRMNRSTDIDYDIEKPKKM